MKIFISWSGDKSRQVAEYLKKWIEQIIQAAEPWISVDIDKGKKWNQEIIQNLESSKVGIFCVTRDCINSPWMLFEAGAISKSQDSYVCTFLIDLSPTDLTEPFSIFQATRFNKDDIFKLLLTINQGISKQGERNLSTDTLKSLFETFYPQLEVQINEIIDNSTVDIEKNLRTDRELLEESVQILRILAKSQDGSTDALRLLAFYAEKYAKKAGLTTFYSVGEDDYVNDFMRYIDDNPLLLEYFGSKKGLKEYIQKEYDGLPF